MPTLPSIVEYLLCITYKVFSFSSHPGYFGKVGMRNFHLKKNQKFMPIINIDKLWSLVTTATREKYKKDPEGKAPVIDVVNAVSTTFFFLHAL